MGSNPTRTIFPPMEPKTPEQIAAHLRDATPEQLDRFLDDALADLWLANKYKHNEAAVASIRQYVDMINAEKGRRS